MEGANQLGWVYKTKTLHDDTDMMKSC